MNGDDKIGITLSVNEWNVVIGMLAKQPYENAAPLIQSITAQAQQGMAQRISLNGAGELRPIPPAVAPAEPVSD